MSATIELSKDFVAAFRRYERAVEAAENAKRTVQESDTELRNAVLALGKLLRIADGVERMAENWNALIAARDHHQRQHDYWRAEAERHRRRITALRGVITRMKTRPKPPKPDVGGAS